MDEVSPVCIPSLQFGGHGKRLYSPAPTISKTSQAKFVLPAQHIITKGSFNLLYKIHYGEEPTWREADKNNGIAVGEGSRKL